MFIRIQISEISRYIAAIFEEKEPPTWYENNRKSRVRRKAQHNPKPMSIRARFC